LGAPSSATTGNVRPEGLIGLLILVPLQISTGFLKPAMKT